MSNKTQLQTNNTTLDGYIARINAAKEVAASLPDAGGSGGASVETCTVEISSTTVRYYAATRYVDGLFVAECKNCYASSSATITDVVVGSCFVMTGDYTSEIANCTLIGSESADMDGFYINYYIVGQ